MTIKDVIDYVDRIKKNEFTTEEKTRWINEIEGYVQIQIMLLAQPECISYCYSSESEQSGISFPADNQMRLTRKLKAHVGGFLKIEGLVTYPENNLSGLAILSISDNGKLIEFEQGTFPQTGETPESAIAQIAFDGQDTELLVPAPFERLYYEYVLAKISENLEENSAQNNRLATFDETWQNYAEWYANTYKPGDGKAVFKGYYIAGKQGVPGPAGPPGKNVYNVRLTTSAESITADKTYAELTEQLEAGVMVIPVVDGKAFTSNAVKTDNTIVFTSAEDGSQPTLKGYSVNASDEWTVFTVALPTTAQVSAKYTKPASGIPKADLANDVQASLDKADAALQEHQSLAAYRTSADQDVIDGSKQDKLIAGENITIAEDGKTISATGGVSNAIEYFEVTLTAQDGVLAADKTFEQVKAAVADGKPVLKVHSDGDVLWFFLLDKSSAEIDFVGFVDEQILAYLTAKQNGSWETTVAARVTVEMLSELSDKLGNLGNLTTTAKNNLVAAINEVKQAADKKQDKLIAGENITISADGKTISATGGGGGSTSISMRVDGGYVQYSTDNGKTWVNLIAEADLKGDKGDKGDKGADGKDGAPGVYYGTTQPTGDTHPVWIDPDGDHDDGGLLPAVTAADNGKVLRVVSSAWTAADMPTGGTDMGITGATVGQIAKIAAVDASGIPTAWEPVDMPSGGSSEDMRVIKTITITADNVNSIYFNNDDNGLPFVLTKHIRIRMYGAAKNTGSTQATLYFRAGQTIGDEQLSAYPIKVNAANANYIFDFVWDLYSAVNCWYGDYAHARAATEILRRYVPSGDNNLSDITVREIKLVWSNASVFFQQGATIVVEGI